MGEGSFTTTSNSIAEKLKMLKQNKRTNINAESKGEENSYSLPGRGPVKATRAVLKTQEEEVEGLVIDNRKKPMSKQRSKGEELESERVPKLDGERVLKLKQSAARKDHGHQTEDNMRKTNLGEEAAKYILSEDLEPLTEPERELKKAIQGLENQENWDLACLSCNTIRRAAKHHQSLLLQKGNYIS